MVVINPASISAGLIAAQGCAAAGRRPARALEIQENPRICASISRATIKWIRAEGAARAAGPIYLIAGLIVFAEAKITEQATLPMPWLLLLHIVSLLCWIAALLFLPTLIATRHARYHGESGLLYRHESVARFVFTRIATPAALVAITSGTLTIEVGQASEPWLVLKLTLVVALVICHLLLGVLIQRVEDGMARLPVRRCWFLGVAVCVLVASIFLVVLAKPQLGDLL